VFVSCKVDKGVCELKRSSWWY